MKEIALDVMQELDIYKPYINGFRAKKEKVCYFENYAGFWVYQKPEVEEKMHELEKNGRLKVYAITHEYTEFGELYDFLYVPSDAEDIDFSEMSFIDDKGRKCHYAYAYVWNKDCEEFSEYGDIVVHSFGGGIKRVY